MEKHGKSEGAILANNEKSQPELTFKLPIINQRGNQPRSLPCQTG